MGNLLATKPLHLLMEEARETGEHSLKRTLGVFQLTALGVGICFVRNGMRFRRSVLCRVRRDDSPRRQRLYLCLRHHG